MFIVLIIYNNKAKELGYAELSDTFENKKAILYDRLVIKNADEKYGVIDTKWNEIIGTRYTDILFNEDTNEFTIINQYGQAGIDNINGETKIGVNYQEIKSINKLNKLYLVKNNNKYGIIDEKEKVIINIEYDNIGVDISPYIGKNDSEKEEKKYVFFDKIIPVEKDRKYGFYDINGNIVTDIKYNGIGCYFRETLDARGKIIESNMKTTNNILAIDEYEAIIVESQEGYGVIDIEGKEIVRTRLKDIYYVINEGEKNYYMTYNDQTYNLEEVFKEAGMSKKTLNQEGN